MNGGPAGAESWLRGRPKETQVPAEPVGNTTCQPRNGETRRERTLTEKPSGGWGSPRILSLKPQNEHQSAEGPDPAPGSPSSVAGGFLGTHV